MKNTLLNIMEEENDDTMTVSSKRTRFNCFCSCRNKACRFSGARRFLKAIVEEANLLIERLRF